MMFNRPSSRPPNIINNKDLDIFNLSKGLKQLWDIVNDLRKFVSNEIAKIQRSIGNTLINRLVFPNTNTTAIYIDSDGGLVMFNIWRFIVITNNLHLQFDSNLGIGARSWVDYTISYPSL